MFINTLIIKKKKYEIEKRMKSLYQVHIDVTNSC